MKSHYLCLNIEKGGPEYEMVNLHEEKKVRNSEICFYQTSSFANFMMILLLVIPITYDLTVVGPHVTRPKIYNHLQRNYICEVIASKNSI